MTINYNKVINIKIHIRLKQSLNLEFNEVIILYILAIIINNNLLSNKINRKLILVNNKKKKEEKVMGGKQIIRKMYNLAKISYLKN